MAKQTKKEKINVKVTDVPKQENPDVFAPKKVSTKKNSKTPELSKLLQWVEFGKESASKKHWEYFVIDQFLRGNHNVRGNPNDNTIVITRKSDSVYFPINKIYSTFRAVRAFVTRHKPKADIEVSSLSDKAKTYARRANKLLERDNQLNNSRRINKEWVYYGIKYGLGWRQIGYDKEKKCSIRWSVDPNHLLVGSRTGRAQDAPYLIKGLIRTVGYWKNKYPESNIAADNKIGINQYEELAKEIDVNTTNQLQTPDEETAIGYEAWYRLFEPNSMGGLINKCLFTENEILDAEETPFKEYPFIPYEAEVLPNETFPDGHLKHVIAPQRLLNLLNTQLLEYNHIVNRGRFVLDKNAGFNSIFAKEGQLIFRNAGKRIEVLPPPPLNPVLGEQMNMAEGWIEDLGGQHDASMGQAPERLTSGKAVEALQLGDSNNISDLRDNFEDALSLEASWILKMYSLFEKDGIVMEDELEEDKIDKFAVVGQEAGKVPSKYYDDGGYCDVCAILPDNEVKVSVTSELGETKQARLDLLLDLAGEGIISKQSVLKHLEFPNTTETMKQLAEEEAGDIMSEMVKARGSQPPAVPPVAPPVETEGGTLQDLMALREQAQNDQ